MDELFYLLLFVFFILLPLLEGWRKRRSGSAGGSQPGQRRRAPSSPGPGPQRERPRPQYTEPAGTTAGGRAGSDTAAEDVIPDELWELLTGERRRRPAPEPEPEALESEWASESESEPFPAPDPEPAYQPAGIPEYERTRARREARVPAYVPAPSRAARAAPQAPSYPVPARRARPAPKPPRSPHASFDWAPSTHRRTDRRRTLGLRDLTDLRRAVVLREVLGSPKALQQGGGGVPGLERPDRRR